VRDMSIWRITWTCLSANNQELGSE